MAALHLVPPAPAQPLSILTEEFPKKLATFNDLTRDMREAGIVIIRAGRASVGGQRRHR